MSQKATSCLFCKSLSPATTVEHIIPESLGNDDLLLKGEVCDRCQNYFGKEIENYVLSKSPFAFWRVHIGIKTKKGVMPYVDLSQPEHHKGSWSDQHPIHDNGVRFGCHDDGSGFIEIHQPDLWNEVFEAGKRDFKFVLTPKMLFMMGRFLLKVGLELICLDNSERARTPLFDDARKYSRQGSTKELWPLFHFSDGLLDDVRKIEPTVDGWIERYTCYGFRILESEGIIAGGQCYVLLELKIGTDVWVICLSERYPHPVIRAAFPEKELKLIWYSSDELSPR